MKTAPDQEPARRAMDDGFPDGVTLPFSVVAFQPCKFGAKRGKATIEIAGFGSVKVDLVVPENKPAFAAPSSTRSKFGGHWETCVAFDDDFAAEVCAALLAYAAAESDGGL